MLKDEKKKKEITATILANKDFKLALLNDMLKDEECMKMCMKKTKSRISLTEEEIINAMKYDPAKMINISKTLMEMSMKSPAKMEIMMKDSSLMKMHLDITAMMLTKNDDLKNSLMEMIKNK